MWNTEKLENFVRSWYDLDLPGKEPVVYYDPVWPYNLIVRVEYDGGELVNDCFEEEREEWYEYDRDERALGRIWNE